MDQGITDPSDRRPYTAPRVGFSKGVPLLPHLPAVSQAPSSVSGRSSHAPPTSLTGLTPRPPLPKSSTEKQATRFAPNAPNTPNMPHSSSSRTPRTPRTLQSLAQTASTQTSTQTSTQAQSLANTSANTSANTNVQHRSGAAAQFKVPRQPRLELAWIPTVPGSVQRRLSVGWVDASKKDSARLVPGLEAFVTANANQIGAPVSKIPQRLHMLKSSPVVCDAESDDVFYDRRNHVWQSVVFPSSSPNTRSEVIHLCHAADIVFAEFQKDQMQKLSSLWDSNKEKKDPHSFAGVLESFLIPEFNIWELVMSEIVRHVYHSCSERGILLEIIHSRMCELWSLLSSDYQRLKSEVEALNTKINSMSQDFLSGETSMRARRESRSRKRTTSMGSVMGIGDKLEGDKNKSLSSLDMDNNNMNELNEEDEEDDDDDFAPGGKAGDWEVIYESPPDSDSDEDEALRARDLADLKAFYNLQAKHLGLNDEERIKAMKQKVQSEQDSSMNESDWESVSDIIKGCQRAIKSLHESFLSIEGKGLSVDQQVHYMEILDSNASDMFSLTARLRDTRDLANHLVSNMPKRPEYESVSVDTSTLEEETKAMNNQTDDTTGDEAEDPQPGDPEANIDNQPTNESQIPKLPDLPVVKKYDHKAIQVSIGKKKSIFKEDTDMETQTEISIDNASTQTSDAEVSCKVAEKKESRLKRRHSLGDLYEINKKIAEAEDDLDVDNTLSNVRAFFFRPGKSEPSDDKSGRSESENELKYDEDESGLQGDQNENEAADQLGSLATGTRVPHSLNRRASSKRLLSNTVKEEKDSSCQTDPVDIRDVDEDEEDAMNQDGASLVEIGERLDSAQKKLHMAAINKWKSTSSFKASLRKVDVLGNTTDSEGEDMFGDEFTPVCSSCSKPYYAPIDGSSQTYDAQLNGIQTENEKEKPICISKSTSTTSLAILIEESRKATPGGLVVPTSPAMQRTPSVSSLNHGVFGRALSPSNFLPIPAARVQTASELERNPLSFYNEDKTSPPKSSRNFAPESKELADIISRNANVAQKRPRTRLWIRKIIKELISAKQVSDQTSDLHNYDHIPMPQFFLLFLKNHYGTRKLVEQQCMCVIQTAQLYRPTDVMVDIFSKLLDESWGLPTLNLFLKAIQLAESLQIGINYHQFPFDSLQTRYICLLRCEEIVRRLFGDRSKATDSAFFKKLIEKASYLEPGLVINRDSNLQRAQLPTRAQQIQASANTGDAPEWDFAQKPMKMEYADFLHIFCTESAAMDRSFDKWLRGLFNRYDSDADGYINETEFLMVVSTVTKPQPVDETEFSWLWKKLSSMTAGFSTEMISFAQLKKTHHNYPPILATFRKNWQPVVEDNVSAPPSVKTVKKQALTGLIRKHWEKMEPFLVGHMQKIRTYPGLESEFNFLIGLLNSLKSLLESGEDGGKAVVLYRRILSVFISLNAQGLVGLQVPPSPRDEQVESYDAQMAATEDTIRRITDFFLSIGN